MIFLSLLFTCDEAVEELPASSVSSSRRRVEDQPPFSIPPQSKRTKKSSNRVKHGPSAKRNFKLNDQRQSSTVISETNENSKCLASLSYEFKMLQNLFALDIGQNLILPRLSINDMGHLSQVDLALHTLIEASYENYARKSGNSFFDNDARLGIIPAKKSRLLDWTWDLQKYPECLDLLREEQDKKVRYRNPFQISPKMRIVLLKKAALLHYASIFSFILGMDKTIVEALDQDVEFVALSMINGILFYPQYWSGFYFWLSTDSEVIDKISEALLNWTLQLLEVLVDPEQRVYLPSVLKAISLEGKDILRERLCTIWNFLSLATKQRSKRFPLFERIQQKIILLRNPDFHVQSEKELESAFDIEDLYQTSVNNMDISVVMMILIVSNFPIALTLFTSSKCYAGLNYFENIRKAVLVAGFFERTECIHILLDSTGGHFSPVRTELLILDAATIQLFGLLDILMEQKEISSQPLFFRYVSNITDPKVIFYFLNKFTTDFTKSGQLFTEQDIQKFARTLEHTLSSKLIISIFSECHPNYIGASLLLATFPKFSRDLQSLLENELDIKSIFRKVMDATPVNLLTSNEPEEYIQLDDTPNTIRRKKENCVIS